MIVLMLSMLVALTVAAPSAFGWANGWDRDGAGPGFKDGYGTHDWVLDNAITMAGSGGAWIRAEEVTALEATDDPDDTTWTGGFDTAYHLFRDGGVGRGAPSEVADRYYRAVLAYRAGDMKTAALHVGILSHYYSDISQPFHSEYDGANSTTLDALHAQYEQDVDKVAGDPGAHSNWINTDGFQPITDARAKTISAASYSRSKYPALIAALKTSSKADDDAVTSAVLNRATNDLRDILQSIPEAAATGAGLPVPPRTIRASMYKYYPAQNTKVRANAVALSASGAPLEGVPVYFKFPLKSGVVTRRAFTDSRGLAYYWQTIDRMPLMVKATVGISSTAGGSTRYASTRVTPSPILPAGSAGIRTTMSNYHPSRNTVVTASTLIRDRAGKGVVGLPVTFTWSFKSGKYSYKAVTNSKGVARVSKNIGGAARGYRVYVRAQTQSGGSNRSSTGSFVPK